jgi:hypothetical protein
METLLDQIDVAADNGLYILGVAGALIVPDIGGAVDSADGQATSARYRLWFDNWAAKHFPPAGAPGHQVDTLTAERCYWFRCNLLHQGTTERPDAALRRILFIEPGGPIVGHLNVMGDVLNLDVRMFCHSMTAAAREWIAASQTLPNFAKNYPNLIRRYPTGWPPAAVGVPVIT